MRYTYGRNGKWDKTEELLFFLKVSKTYKPARHLPPARLGTVIMLNSVEHSDWAAPWNIHTAFTCPQMIRWQLAAHLGPVGMSYHHHRQSCPRSNVHLPLTGPEGSIWWNLTQLISLSHPTDESVLPLRPASNQTHFSKIFFISDQLIFLEASITWKLL